MSHDSPESRDVPPHARTSGPSAARATVAGGLVGGIGVMVVLILTGAIAVPGISRKVVDTASADTTTAASSPTDSAAFPVVLPTTDTALTTTTVDTIPAYAPPVETADQYAVRRGVEPSEPPPLTPEQRVTMYRDALQDAILRADDAEIHAQRRLDSAPLYAVYTGQQLQDQLASVESLRERGVHKDSELRDIQWHSFWVSPDEQTAWVETTERWYTEYHQNGSDTCAAVSPEHDVPQRATLRREGGGWKISSVTFTGTSAQLQACP